MSKINILVWLRDKLTGGIKQMPLSEVYEIAAEFYVRELAFWTAVNFIARTVSKCEFKTMLDGVEVKNKEYYLWNVEPNRNQCSTEFIQKWITTLYMKNECLVIPTTDNRLLVADSYQIKEYAAYEDIFSQVVVGDYTFQRTFKQSEVLYFKLCSHNINLLLHQLYEKYGQLIAYAEKSYTKSRGQKGTLEVPAAMTGTKDEFDRMNDYLDNYAKKFLMADNGVLPLYKGYKYSDIGNKTYANDSTRDIRAMIDDVYDLTARAFGIPPALLRGEVAGISDATDSFLTFCLDPLADMITEEINRKRYGYDAVHNGSKIVIDTKAIKHVDLLSVATAIDKLIASGAFCINDIRAVVGENSINEPWANEHWITKNYTALTEALINQQAEQ